MFKYNLKIALRNLYSQKVYALINIIGLSFGLGSAFIILLFVLHERSYNDFHTDKDRIYRVTNMKFAGDAPYILGTTLENAIPEIEKTARISYNYGINNLYIRQKNDYLPVKEFAFADNSLFSIFSFPIVSGNKNMLLTDPYSVVISKDLAMKIFGSSEVCGKLITIELYGAKANVKITGVIDIPSNSTIKEDLFFPVDFQFNHQKANGVFRFGKDPKTAWNYYLYDTYFLLRKGCSSSAVEAKFPIVDAGLKKGFSKEFRLQALSDVYLHSAKSESDTLPRNDIMTLRIYTTIAILVLLIAMINYIILSIAKASGKMNEMGIRIVSGASRISLIGNSMYETLLTTLFALPLSFTFVEIFTPQFSKIIDKQVSVNYAHSTAFIGGIFVITFITGIIAGGISGIFLSKYKPSEILAKKPLKKQSMVNFRVALILVQFTISIVLAICLIIIYSQLNFVFNKDPGFETKNMLVIKCSNKEISMKMNVFKERLKSNSAIQNVSGTSNSLPTRYHWKEDVMMNNDSSSLQKLEAIDFDNDFIDAMGIKVILGRPYFPDFNEKESILINEQAVKLLNLKKPIGTQTNLGNVIGVVKDFHIHSLHTPIPPMILFNRYESANEIVVRVKDGANLNEVLSFVKKQWTEVTNHETIDYRFIDDDIKFMYLKESRLKLIVSAFLFLAVFLSLLGLYGISIYTAQLRTKEIGIRKVNGATSFSIVLLLTNDISKLVIIASTIAIPIAFYIMHQWLQNFAYKTPLSWWIFAFIGLSALITALTTVSWQAWRAASRNPVEALRYE